MSGKYNLTCFCEKCNTGGLATKSRKTATVGKTVAVHKDLYDLYGADHEIDITNILNYLNFQNHLLIFLLIMEVMVNAPALKNKMKNIIKKGSKLISKTK